MLSSDRKAQRVTSYFNGKARHFHMAGLVDQRGTLVPVEFDALDFTPARIFLINARDGATRGGHAHRSGVQLLLRVSGEIEVTMKLGDDTAGVRLDEHHNALLIASPVWSRQTYRGSGPSILVLSDSPFDPGDYLTEAE